MMQYISIPSTADFGVARHGPDPDIAVAVEAAISVLVLASVAGYFVLALGRLLFR